MLEWTKRHQASIDRWGAIDGWIGNRLDVDGIAALIDPTAGR
jgi:hypothetical protein